MYVHYLFSRLSIIQWLPRTSYRRASRIGDLVGRGAGLLAGLDGDVLRVSADVLQLAVVAVLTGLLACWLAADVALNAAQRTQPGARAAQRTGAHEAGLARLG